MCDKIMVSIICNTYNHKNFIESAIKSFIFQETNFKYEILIHDDASTDGTADIIREYENKYPDLIKPIYQSENQFSQKKGIMRNFQYPRVKGKYIALCEGDDCWISANKLQKQVDFMETNPECTLICHNSKRINYETGKVTIEKPFDREGYVSPVDIIVGNPHKWVATSSLLMKKEIACELPEFYKLSRVGDYALRLHALAMGKVYYLDDIMSTYNFKIPGSWSSGAWKKIIKKPTSDPIKFLQKYNEYTQYKYKDIVATAIKNRKFSDAVSVGDLKLAKESKYKDLYLELSLRNRLRLYIKYYCPIILEITAVFRRMLILCKKIILKNR